MLSTRLPFDFYGFLNFSLQQNLPISPPLTRAPGLLFHFPSTAECGVAWRGIASAIPPRAISIPNPPLSVYPPQLLLLVGKSQKYQFTLASDSGAPQKNATVLGWRVLMTVTQPELESKLPQPQDQT